MDSQDHAKHLSRSNTEFALALYRMIDEKKNIFFSPASINLALTMLRVGAKKETLDQLTKGLHLHLMDCEEDIKKAYRHVMENLNTENDKTILKTANRIYVEQTYKLLKEFEENLKEIFKIESGKVDFLKNAPKATEEINKWVEENTKEKIKNIVEPGLLDPDTRLVLVNAVYFKGLWKTQFPPDETEPSDFHTSSTTKITVDMMSVEEEFYFTKSEELNCKVLNLGYIFFSLDMFVLLPERVDGLDDLVTKLNSGNIDTLIDSLSEEMVTVKLPKFKLEETYDLKQVLEKMGMGIMFTEMADFTGIGGSNDLYVSAVVHKTFLEVNETGTEAAAATVIVVNRKCDDMREPGEEQEFIADHPFLFLIRDDLTGLIVFMGCLRNPDNNRIKDNTESILIKRSTSYYIYDKIMNKD